MDAASISCGERIEEADADAAPGSRRGQDPGCSLRGGEKERIEAWLARAAALSGDAWRTPDAMSADEGSGCVMEWWTGSRKLTVYAERAGGMGYVKVWGPNMDLEMEAGELADERIAGLLAWLRE